MLNPCVWLKKASRDVEAKVPTFISSSLSLNWGCRAPAPTHPPTFTWQPTPLTLTFHLSQHELGCQNSASTSCLAVQWRKGPAAWLQFWGTKKPALHLSTPESTSSSSGRTNWSCHKGQLHSSPLAIPVGNTAEGAGTCSIPYTQQAHEAEQLCISPSPGASFRSSFTTRRGFSHRVVLQWGLPASPAHQQHQSWK